MSRDRPLRQLSNIRERVESNGSLFAGVRRVDDRHRGPRPRNEGVGPARRLSLSANQRYAAAIGIVLVDLFLFAVPLTGIAIAYVLIVRPPQFREWVARLYD